MGGFFNRTTFIAGIIVVMGIVLTYIFSDIVTYLIISFAIAAILRTPTNYISQLQIFGLRPPRIFAILVSYSLLFGFIALFVLLFAPLVSDQIEVIKSAKPQQSLDKILKPISEIEAFLQEKGIIEATQQPMNEEGSSGQGGASTNSKLVQSIKEYINSTDWLGDNFSSTLTNLLSFTGNFFISFIAVIFITFFILYEKGAIRKYFLSLVPNRYFEVTIVAVTKIERSLSNYLLGILLQMISIFSLASFGLIMVGIDYAVTIAVFAAVMNVIPFLGPILGALFGIVVGIGIPTSQASVATVVSIVAVFVVVQLTDNLFLQPMIFSRSVKAHPLEIFLIVFVGATLAGAIGMILAIPTYTIVKISVTEFLMGYKQYRVFRQ
ncbi:MAG: AI-2E family transporter [Flammeovirgaceae bacterium]